MPNLERYMLEYLGRSDVPLWGGHLQRGDPITDPDMPRWIASGWIRAVGVDGYVLTGAGRAALGAANAN